MHRMGSSQRLPRIMRAWERMHNFIIDQKQFLNEYALLCIPSYVHLLKVVVVA